MLQFLLFCVHTFHTLPTTGTWAWRSGGRQGAGSFRPRSPGPHRAPSSSALPLPPESQSGVRLPEVSLQFPHQKESHLSSLDCFSNQPMWKSTQNLGYKICHFHLWNVHPLISYPPWRWGTLSPPHSSLMYIWYAGRPQPHLHLLKPFPSIYE